MRKAEHKKMGTRSACIPTDPTLRIKVDLIQMGAIFL
jgi:hypothetical protein